MHDQSALNYIIISSYFLLWAINVSYVIRKSPWSIVSESNTGNPIPLTLIRVMDEGNKRLVRTTVSDGKGKFSAILKKGQYNIFAAKEGYKLDHPVLFNTTDNIAALHKKVELNKNTDS
jgi:hypothetical protein